MSESNSGPDIFGLFKKIFPDKKEGPKFTGKQALEKFRLLAAAGPEGQTPRVTYGQGSVVILNQFPPGTILRERYYHQPSDTVQYIWWCIGEFDKYKQQLTLFNADINKIGMPEYLHPDPALTVTIRQVRANTPNGNVEYQLGSQSGILIDLHLHQIGKGIVKSYQESAGRRHTEQIDVIEFGTRVRQTRPERKPGLSELKPAPLPSIS